MHDYSCGLDWADMFGIGPQGKDKALARIKAPYAQLYSLDACLGYLDPKASRPYDEIHVEAYTTEILRFCIEDTSFARDLLGEEAEDKCRELLRRKQFESKQLKTLMSGFLQLAHEYNRFPAMADFLRLPVVRTKKDIRDAKVLKEYLPLKAKVDEITSGVSSTCYLGCGGTVPFLPQAPYGRFSDGLNSFITREFGYDYNTINIDENYSLFMDRSECIGFLKRLMRDALLPDEGFWNAHEGDDIIRFIEIVRTENDPAHAEKLLGHIFSEIKRDPVGGQMMERGIPLFFMYRDRFVADLEGRTRDRLFGRLKDRIDVGSIDAGGLGHPLTCPDGIEVRLEKGRTLFDGMLRRVYGDYYGEAVGFIAAEVESPSTPVVTGEEWTIRTVFDCDTFGYHKNVMDRTAAEIYCPDFFSGANIWNRAYLKAYAVCGLLGDGDACEAYLFEDFYDLFRFVEEKKGIRTTYQRDDAGRSKAYDALKKLLKRRGVEITDNRREDYVISLLDRKVAVRGESLRFPVLEQIGDAVYGFAVAEMLFFDPGKEPGEVVAEYQKLIDAKSQIKIAKRIGTDRLYLSSFTISDKYERDTVINADTEMFEILQENESYSDSYKYIADSLEMIIGTVALDLGYLKAIEFAKTILRETFGSEFGEEVHSGDAAAASYSRAFRKRIGPTIDEKCDSAQMTMWRAFDKIFKVIVLGTDDVETRNFITRSMGSMTPYDEECEESAVNMVFYDYLYNSLYDVVIVHGERVAENFKKLMRR